MATGELVRRLHGHIHEVNGCAFRPDGRLLVISSRDGTLRLWHVPDGEFVRIFEGHTNGVTICAFSPDGRLIASTSWDCTLRLWEASSGALTCVLQGLDGALNHCAFRPDGSMLVVTTCSDKTLHLWDTVARREPARWHVDASIYGCAWHPTDALVVAGNSVGNAHVLGVDGPY